MPDDTWDFSDEELDSLFATEAAEESQAPPAQEDETFAELGGMCRQIAVQYVDIIASYAAATLQGKQSVAREAVAVTANALLRLAHASHDSALISLAQALICLAGHKRTGKRARQRQRRELRDWLTAFAAYLPPEEQASIRRIIEYDFRTQPLLQELSEIRGIGKRRLQSLYTAGLFEVQALSIADPAEVASATGIPIRLAEASVQRAKVFAVEQRSRTVESLRRMVAEFARTVRANGIDPDADEHLLLMAQESLSELQSALMETGIR